MFKLRRVCSLKRYHLNRETDTSYAREKVREEGTMVKTLELAMSKAAGLWEAAQEQLGLELLERMDALADLRAEIEIGLRELDAGLGEDLDIEDLTREARDEYARKV
jgi:hypothetical protein